MSIQVRRLWRAYLRPQVGLDIRESFFFRRSLHNQILSVISNLPLGRLIIETGYHLSDLINDFCSLGFSNKSHMLKEMKGFIFVTM